MILMEVLIAIVLVQQRKIIALILVKQRQHFTWFYITMGIVIIFLLTEKKLFVQSK